MSYTVDEIEDFNSLYSWLKERSIEDARLIAFRGALRALPIVGRAARQQSLGDTILLATLRAQTVARVAGTWPEHVAAVNANSDVAAKSAMRAAASTSAYASDAAAVKAVPAADAAAYAADAAAATHTDRAATDAAAAADATADAASTAAPKDSYAARATSYAVVREDALSLTNGACHTALAMSPLWPEDKTPIWFHVEWDSLSQTLSERGDGWEVWVKWYQEIIDGELADEETQLQIALIPEEKWNRGAKVVNAEVARILATKKSGGASTSPGQIDLDVLLATKDLRAALADFELDELAKLIRMVPFVEDIKTLDDPTLAEARASMLSEMAALMGDLSRDIPKHAGNAPGWLSTEANRYGKEAKRGIGPDGTRPGRLWDIGLALAGALRDEDVEWSLGRHLFEKLEHAVDKHRDLMREYFAGALARMRPLDLIEPAEDATPEKTVDALAQAVDGLDEQDWGGVAPPDPEISAVMADRVEELRDILDRLNRVDPSKKAALEETFWRKAKSASMTVLRYGLKVGAIGAIGGAATLQTAAAVYTFWPETFKVAVEAIRAIFPNVTWLF